MTVLLLGLLFGLLLDGAKGQESLHRFSRPDQEVSLPCGELSKNNECTKIQWLSNTASSITLTEAEKGRVNSASSRSHRLSLTPDCSLLIRQVSGDDVGYYTCRLTENIHHDVRVYLSILKISLIPQNHDPRKDDEVKLQCSLLIDPDPSLNKRNHLRWVDENGAEVTEGVSQTKIESNCLSYLAVTHQSTNNKKFTCQVVNRQNTVELEADYTPFIRDDGGTGGGPGSGPGPDPDPGSSLTFVIVGVLLVAFLLLVVTTVVLIKHRRRAKAAEDIQAPTQQPVELESSLTYATVRHHDQTGPKKKVFIEEEVTYSTVRSAMRTEDVSDPNSLYCSVSKPK